jgi:hypothetical protein
MKYIYSLSLFLILSYSCKLFSQELKTNNDRGKSKLASTQVKNPNINHNRNESKYKLNNFWVESDVVDFDGNGSFKLNVRVYKKTPFIHRKLVISQNVQINDGSKTQSKKAK